MGPANALADFKSYGGSLFGKGPEAAEIVDTAEVIQDVSWSSVINEVSAKVQANKINYIL